jgi:hypothetical protein
MKSALVMALLVLSLLLFGTLLSLTSKDLRMTTELLTSEQAYYLAEAGLARAEQQTQLDPTWRGEWQQVALGAGHYSVRVYEQGGLLQIESMGVIGKVKVGKAIRKNL